MHGLGFRVGALYLDLRGQTLQLFVAKMICQFLKFYPYP